MTRAINAGDRRSLFVLAGLIVLCLFVGLLGSLVTLPKIPTWYAGLQKPFFTPPNWVFGPAWTALYIIMAVAAWRVWRAAAEGRSRRLALIVFAGQLALNLTWSFAFFGAQSPLLGVIVIAALAAMILWTTALFARLDRGAAWLMAPYAAWVAYAAALNIAILVLN